MNDIFGNKLEINDEVATTIFKGRKTSHELEIARVIGFTDKKLELNIC